MRKWLCIELGSSKLEHIAEDNDAIDADAADDNDVNDADGINDDDVAMMLMLWPLAVTPGVTYFGEYHRPSESHF